MAPATTWTIPPAILSCEVNWIGPHRMPWCKPVGMAPRLGTPGDSIQDFLDNNQINRFTIMVRLFYLYLILYYCSSCYSCSYVQTYWSLFGNPIVALLDGPLPDWLPGRAGFGQFHPGAFMDYSQRQGLTSWLGISQHIIGFFVAHDFLEDGLLQWIIHCSKESWF